MNPELKITKDGSHTLFLPELNEHYHSFHGAFQESQYVFIRQGLEYILARQQPPSILEVGFGTGLNALLTLKHIRSAGLSCTYTSLEKYPLSLELIRQLNYTAQPELEPFKDAFFKLHTASWNEKQVQEERFILHKIHGTLETYTTTERFNLVYFDAFAPEKQPELWTLGIFLQLFHLLEPGGILVTYCAKGAFKRNLKAAGFWVEALPGPPGKREMTRAHKPLD